MVKGKRWWAALWVLLVWGAGSIPAFGASVGLTPAMRALPFETIGTYESVDGEGLRVFLLRIAPVLAAYTHRTGWEACAAIASNGQGRYGVVIGSNHSQIGCLAGEAGVPGGMEDTGETLHSHPDRLQFRLTETDREFLIATGDIEGAKIADYSVGLDNGFSRADVQTPGYLVASGWLLYQPGRPVPRPRVIGRVTYTSK